MKLIKRYSSIYCGLPIPVKASIWFTIMSIVQKGISFLVTPIYTRLLTVEEYGYYSLYTSWLNLFGVFATLNLSAGVFNNGMLKYERDRCGFISSLQGLSSLTTTVVAIIVLSACHIWGNYIGLDNIIIICIFVVLLFGQPTSFWTEYQKYNFEYRKLVILTIAMALLTPLFSVYLFYKLAKPQYAVIFGYAFVQIIVGMFFYIYNIIKGKKIFCREYWLYALKFNCPLIPHYLSYIILGQSDRIMIEHFCGEDKLGIYSLAYSISLLINIIVNAINSVLTPWVYRKIKAKEYEIVSKCSINIILLMTVITILAILLAPELIRFLGTEKYLEAQWIVPPVMLSCFFTMIYNLFGVIVFYYEKSKYVMCTTVTAAISNILLNYIFIPRFGFLAAGYTTLASYILLAILSYFAMRKVCNSNGLHGVLKTQKIFCVALCTTFICIFLSCTYLNWLFRYILFLTLIIVIAIKWKTIMRFIKTLR